MNTTIDATNNTACPKHPEHGPMEYRQGMFYWRGDHYPGWVCVPCNALWAMKGEEMPPLKGEGI